MADIRYLYEVKPLRPVPFGGRSVRVPASMLLTKDEVMYFMGYGPVYRKFVDTDILEPVKVTGENIDSLHCDYPKTATKKEYNAPVIEEVAMPEENVVEKNVIEDSVAEDAVEVSAPVEEKEVVEEVIPNEEPEEVVAAPVEEDVESDDAEVEDTTDDETVESSAQVDDGVLVPTTVKFQNSKHNNKHKH